MTIPEFASNVTFARVWLREDPLRYLATVAFDGRTMDDYWRFRQGYAGEPIEGLIIQVGGAADDGMRIISIWESKADHDRFIAERLHPVLQPAPNPSRMTITEFAVDNLLIGPAIPRAQQPAETVKQDDKRKELTMRLPPLTAEELDPFVTEGLWIAKLATQNQDHSMRITPLTYAVDGDEIVFSTWENSDAVRNIRRDSRASVLIDKADQPYAGVHYTGRAHAQPETTTPEEHGKLFGRYSGDETQAAAEYSFLTSLGLGDRAEIRFHPETTVTWDFNKI